jgi:hypothetical protein
MKKIFAIALLMVSTNLWSQFHDRKIIVRDGQLNFDVNIQTGNILRHGLRNDVNSRAMRHFIKSFDNATNIAWQITEEGSTVTFSCNDKKVAGYYNKLGDHLYTIKTYGEAQLDPTILKVVKKNVADDFSIYGVNERITTNASLYEIILQNSTYWCKIILTRNKNGSVEKFSENTLFLKG